MNDLDMQHGTDWQGEDLAGWIVTEKLDGCRAYWDGAALWTRGGKTVNLPEHWRQHLPAGIALDGELYDGGGTAGRARCATALRYGGRHFGDTMRFVVFDAPEASGNWAARMAVVESAIAEDNPHVQPIYWRTCDSTKDALELMESIQAMDGEGVMLRRPDLRYTPGRTRDLLKLKEDIRDMRVAA